MRQIMFRDAMREALRSELLRDENVILMGEGSGARGGAFLTTRGLLAEFGKDRIRDTPISECGFTGTAVGAAACGMRPVVDLMFIDLSMLAMDQIVNQAAKLRYLSVGKISVPIVILVVTGVRSSAGAHHSQSLYPCFINIPGLKVVMPTTPYDAKGLLITSIRDDDPVIYLETGILFGMKGNVPQGEYTIPFGKAAVRRKGSDITVIALGQMVHRTLQASDILTKGGISIEVVDPRTLFPYDEGTILESVKKTGRLAIVDEGYSPCGFSSEIGSFVASEGFEFLRAPIKKINTFHVPIPFSPPLEQFVTPSVDRIANEISEMF